MAERIGLEFEIDPSIIKSLPFNYFAAFPDIIQSEDFEMIPTRHVNWTETEWEHNR